jgi:hypothetical protein
MILNLLLLRSFHQAEGNPFDGLKDTGKKARPGNGPTPSDTKKTSTRNEASHGDVFPIKIG